MASTKAEQKSIHDKIGKNKRCVLAFVRAFVRQQSREAVGYTGISRGEMGSMEIS